jgi:hypothetical protein
MKNLKVFLLLVGAAFVLFAFTFGMPWSVYRAHNESKTYLEQTYGEAFNVGIPRFWIMDGNYHAEASPTARPDLNFSVGTEQGTDGITDNYVFNSWRYEGKKAIEPIFSPYYDSKQIYVDITTVPNSGEMELYAFRAHTSLDIIIAARKVKMASITEESKKIFDMIMKLNEQQIPVGSLNIRYETKNISLKGTQLKQIENAEQLQEYWEINTW